MRLLGKMRLFIIFRVSINDWKFTPIWNRVYVWCVLGWVWLCIWKRMSAFYCNFKRGKTVLRRESLCWVTSAEVAKYCFGLFRATGKSVHWGSSMFQMHVHVVCVIFFVFLCFFSKRIIAVLTPRIPSLGIVFEVAKCSFMYSLRKEQKL